MDANLACCAQNAGSGRGEIRRTTDGGSTWTTVTNSTQFAGPDSYLNWVHFFDANVGIAFGDASPGLPAAGGGAYEMYRTTNGSAATPTWVRVASPALLQTDEYEVGAVDCFAAVGNTLWLTTAGINGPGALPCRVLRSTDRGQTWTSARTPLRGVIRVAFKDQNNGIASNTNIDTVGLARTTDGGLTWTSVPIPAGRDTLHGKFYTYNVVAIPGRGFMSMGRAIPANFNRSNYGVSFSADGTSWYDLEKGGQAYTAAGFIACTANADPRAFQGYIGSFTRTGSVNPGAGGLYQISATTCALTPLATLPHTASLPGLTMFPNPSNGVFELLMSNGLSTVAQLTVFDAMGRAVVTRELPATGAVPLNSRFDLRQERRGIYTLKLTTTEAVSTAKLVIE